MDMADTAGTQAAMGTCKAIMEGDGGDATSGWAWVSIEMAWSDGGGDGMVVRRWTQAGRWALAGEKGS